MFSKEISLWSRLLLFATTVLFLNVKKILAVINATYAVAKRKPEKIRLAGIFVDHFLCCLRTTLCCVRLQQSSGEWAKKSNILGLLL